MDINSVIRDELLLAIRKRRGEPTLDAALRRAAARYLGTDNQPLTLGGVLVGRQSPPPPEPVMVTFSDDLAAPVVERHMRQQGIPVARVFTAQGLRYARPVDLAEASTAALEAFSSAAGAALGELSPPSPIILDLPARAFRSHLQPVGGGPRWAQLADAASLIFFDVVTQRTTGLTCYQCTNRHWHHRFQGPSPTSSARYPRCPCEIHPSTKRCNAPTEPLPPNTDCFSGLASP